MIPCGGKGFSGAQQQKVKKRISVIDDMMRTSGDDSDADGDGDASGSVVRQLRAEQDEDARVETSSKSDSLLPTPSDGWDISPDGINTPNGLENSIAERAYSPCPFVALRLPTFIIYCITLVANHG